MSAGRFFEGPGSITWWGFSPACDLMDVGESAVADSPHNHRFGLNASLGRMMVKFKLG